MLSPEPELRSIGNEQIEVGSHEEVGRTADRPAEPAFVALSRVELGYRRIYRGIVHKTAALRGLSAVNFADDAERIKSKLRGIADAKHGFKWLGLVK